MIKKALPSAIKLFPYMSNEKKTFIILTPGFPENEADSACLPLQQSFIRTLKELYPQLEIIVLSFQHPYHKKKYKWFGMTVIPFSGRNKGGLIRLVLRKRIYATLKSLHKRNRITGLLSFWCNECAWVGKHFGDKYDIKHYCWLLGQDAKKENKYPQKLRPKTEELIALSDFLQDEFEKNHSIRPSYVVRPGIDPKQYQQLPAEKDIDILAAGSLIPLKQYDIFLQVVAGIKKQIPLVKVVLIGEGQEKEKLKNLITTLGLQSNVLLTAELPHPEVLLWMGRSKVFLHTSSYEGFGVVCIEALHAAAHVVSFVKPMNANIQNWHIAGNKEEMIQKTVEILKNPATEYNRVTPYLLEDSVKKMMELFSSKIT
jgi:glycosyltransferase involved in cell wall biosynthesis